MPVALRALGPDEPPRRSRPGSPAPTRGSPGWGSHDTAVHPDHAVTGRRAREGGCLLAEGNGRVVGTLAFHGPEPCSANSWARCDDVAAPAPPGRVRGTVAPVTPTIPVRFAALGEPEVKMQRIGRGIVQAVGIVAVRTCGGATQGGATQGPAAGSPEVTRARVFERRLRADEAVVFELAGGVHGAVAATWASRPLPDATSTLEVVADRRVRVRCVVRVGDGDGRVLRRVQVDEHGDEAGS